MWLCTTTICTFSPRWLEYCPRYRYSGRCICTWCLRRATCHCTAAATVCCHRPRLDHPRLSASAPATTSDWPFAFTADTARARFHCKCCYCIA